MMNSREYGKYECDYNQVDCHRSWIILEKVIKKYYNMDIMKESERIINKYHNRIPIIVKKKKDSKLPDIDKRCMICRKNIHIINKLYYKVNFTSLVLLFFIFYPELFLIFKTIF